MEERTSVTAIVPIYLTGRFLAGKPLEDCSSVHQDEIRAIVARLSSLLPFPERDCFKLIKKLRLFFKPVTQTRPFSPTYVFQTSSFSLYDSMHNCEPTDFIDRLERVRQTPSTFFNKFQPVVPLPTDRRGF